MSFICCCKRNGIRSNYISSDALLYEQDSQVSLCLTFSVTMPLMIHNYTKKFRFPSFIILSPVLLWVSLHAMTGL